MEQITRVHYNWYINEKHHPAYSFYQIGENGVVSMTRMIHQHGYFIEVSFQNGGVREIHNINEIFYGEQR